MKIFEVVTGYAGTGALNNPYHPVLADKYALAEWVDVTGLTVTQIKVGGATTTISVRCVDNTYTQINADKSFTVKAIPIEEELLEADLL